jgi:hypothetical protein
MSYVNSFEEAKDRFFCKLQDVEEQLNTLIREVGYAKTHVQREDFMVACLIGLIGGFVSNNSALNTVLRAIHDGPRKVGIDENSVLYPILDKLNKFFTHGGDWIDQPVKGAGYIGRNGEKVPIYAHRIRWGHDVFSISGDNPFALSMEQYGRLRGILKAIKHLTADTFSSQGLPIPFHSYFDTASSNLIEEWIKKLASVSVGVPQSPGRFSFVLRKVFSINAQDVVASTLIVTLANLYVKFKPLDYALRAKSFKLTSYTISFLTNLGYNLIVYRVPAVNWALIPAILKEILSLYGEKHKVGKEISERMELLLRMTNDIEEENKRLLSFVQKRNIVEKLRYLDKEFSFFSSF